MSSLVFLIIADGPPVGIGSVFIAFRFSLEVAMVLNLKQRYSFPKSLLGKINKNK